MAKFCGKCGSPLDPATGICSKCVGVKEAASDKVAEPQPDPKAVYRSKGVPKAKKRRGKPPVLTVILTVILMLSFLLTSSLAVGILNVRNTFKEKNIEKLIDGVRASEAVIFACGGSRDLLDNFYDYMSRCGVIVTDRKLDYYVDSAGVKPFVAQKAAELFDGVIKGDVEVEIDKTEISDLIFTNRDAFCDTFGISLEMATISYITNSLFDEECLFIEIDDNIMLSVASPALSYITVIVLVLVSLFILLLMLINSPWQGSLTAGLDLTVMGGVVAIPGFISAWMTPVWQAVFGDGFLATVIGNLFEVNAPLSAILLLLGLFLAFVGIIIKIICVVVSKKKKAAK
ncbi:MAG: zinc ribbon domain-containing protein [Clostridia bacterium]|nr:zinc ribbon domain-containing protein [Clostridia bacterium]